jgi:amidase
MKKVGQKATFLASSLLMLGVLPDVAQASSFKLEEATISEAREAFTEGTLTSRELTQAYLDRIALDNRSRSNLNAIAVVNPNALQEAARLDRLRAQGTILSPLHGIPVVLKDSYNVKGLPTSNGVAALKSLIAKEDAFAVQQLREAGAVILGKANMSTWAFSYDGISEAYGAVINPYAPDRTPGGSSSGSAVAVAANFTMFAMGGETGGSIRVPSTHNAIVGLKPSAGLISVDGTWPLVTERDVIGPMARTVSDVATVMDALVAFDPNNIWNPYIPNVEATRPDSYTDFLDSNSLDGKVLGLPRPYIGKGDPNTSFPLDPQVANAFEQAKQVLRNQGATLVEVDIPAYSVNPSPEYLASSFDRDLRSRAYYYEQLIEGYDDDRIRSFVDLLDIVPEDNQYIDFIREIADTIASGRDLPWEDLPAVGEALREIARLRTQEYENFMTANNIDAFAFPTLNYLAPPQGPEAEEVYNTFGTLPARLEANVLGVPGITVPMGYSREGIPMSLEFLGNYFGESEIIGYAFDYEQATRFRLAPGLPIPEPATVPALLLLAAGVLVRQNLKLRQKAVARRTGTHRLNEARGRNPERP